MITARTLKEYVERQIQQIVPGFNSAIEVPIDAVEVALARVEANVAAQLSGGGRFDPLMSGQYASFIYYLSHSLRYDPVTATHLFLLNKALNGIDLFYNVVMPDHFLIGHTVGMVFAKASYGDYCVFHQGCTVGRLEQDRPVLGRGVVIYPGWCNYWTLRDWP